VAEVNVFDAARCLGISVDTVRRRIHAGELKARQARQGHNFTWWVDLPDDLVILEAEASRSSREEAPSTQEPHDNGPANVTTANVQALLESQAALISALQAQVQAQQEELAAKNQQISQLHVLLQQAQAALPAPREGRSWWWRWWGGIKSN
jgi:hypothetical protein